MNDEDYSIDETDRRLIATLQQDGRITNQALAQRCGLSPAACHDRVRRLRERGVIRATVALIEPKALDCDMLFFYGPNGLLVHEEPYITETAPEVLRELA